MTADRDPPPSSHAHVPALRRPVVRIRPVSALGDRLLLEYERRVRHGVQFSVVAVRHFLWHDDGPEAREDLRRHVAASVAAVVRVSDAVFDVGLPGCHVAVLPHTSPTSAEVVVQRIEKRARDAPVGDFGPVSVDCVSFDGVGPEPAALLARIDSHFREQAFGHLDERREVVRPPARLPVGDLTRLEEALHTEINLAGRGGTSLSVVALATAQCDETVPGLLACDVDDVTARTIRGCDQVFEVGPACVALILARTCGDDAVTVAERVADELREECPDAPYGAVRTTVLEFSREYRDASAFLTALARLAS